MGSSMGEFLSLLNPCDGAVFLGTQKGVKGRYKQYKYDTVEEAVEDAASFSNIKDMNVWFSLASFKDTSSRHANNAKSMRAVFIDVDCGEGKPFATQREGLASVIAFAKKLRLPTPLLVDSGKGVHAYWVFDAPVPIDEWRKVANAVKSQFPSAKWEDEEGNTVSGTVFDPTVTADAARVTRLVGSVNPKTGKPVRVLRDAPPVAYKDMAHTLSAFINSAPKFKPQSAESQLLANLSNIYGESPPADPDIVTQKCAQVEWCVTNQDKVGEPMWYALMGLASFCEDPEHTAIAWSNKHPGFSPDETVAKMQQWKANTDGPPTCSRFEDLNPAGCKGCPYKDKISTPLRVGVRSKKVEASEDITEADPLGGELPPGFHRTTAGIVYIAEDIEVPVCSFEIYPVDYGRREGVEWELAWFRWYRKNVGWCELEMRISTLISTDKTNKDFITAIADQGILMDSVGQAGRFQMLLRGYIKQLQEQQTITNQYSTFGWKDDKDFLLGDMLYKSDGTKKDLAPSNVTITKRRLPQDMFYTKGSLAKWKAYHNVMTRCGFEHMKFAILIGFAAPLAQPAKVKGSTIHFYGPSGAGKTLAQKVQLSIYGDPEKSIQSSFTTVNAFIDTLATRNSLPVCMDESTVWTPKSIGEVLYWVEQGTNKSRLNRAGKSQDLKTWHTLLTTSGNRSIASDIESAGFQSDAQMARLVEMNIDANTHLTRRSDVGRALFNTYTDNFGVAGDIYISELVSTGYEVLQAQFEETRIQMRKDLGADFSGVERFYEDVFALAYLGGKIAQSLDLIDFDVRSTMVWAYRNLNTMRQELELNKMEPMDYLIAYLNEFAKNRVDVMYTTTSSHIVSTPEFMPTGGIVARLEMHRDKMTDKPHTGVIYLQRSKFKKWLAALGMDFRTIEEAIKSRGLDIVIPGDRLLLGKHTPLKVAQERVIGVSMECPELRGLLTDADNALTEKQLKKLQVVK